MKPIIKEEDVLTMCTHDAEDRKIGPVVDDTNSALPVRSTDGADDPTNSFVNIGENMVVNYSRMHLLRVANLNL